MLILLCGVECIAFDANVPLPCKLNKNTKATSSLTTLGFWGVGPVVNNDEFNTIENFDIILLPDNQVLYIDGKVSPYKIVDINDYYVKLINKNDYKKDSKDETFGIGSDNVSIDETLSINRISGSINGKSILKIESLYPKRAIVNNHYVTIISGNCKVFTGEKMF